MPTTAADSALFLQFPNSGRIAPQPGEQPPVVGRGLFEQVQEQLHRQPLPEPKPGGSAALLKGLLVV